MSTARAAQTSRAAEPEPDGLLAGDAPVYAACALLAAAAAASGVVWLAAQCAVALSGGGWPAGTFAHAPAYTARLLRTGDPAAAWAAAMPTGTPAPPSWLTWLTLAGLLSAATVLLVLLARRFGPALRPERAGEGARWATAAVERRIAVPEDPAARQWRLVAGRGVRSRRLLAGEDCVSAVAIGPNGSGKTTGLVVPNVLDWPGPVVMTTTKATDAALVYPERARRGPVWVLAPGGCPGLPTACWSPVDYAVDPDAADRMAEWLCAASGLGADPRARAWIAQARKLIKPLLLAANVAGVGIGGFTRWLYDGPAAAEEVKAVLAAAGHAEARREYASTWTIHDEGIGSVLFTAYGLADAYTRPHLAAAAARSDFTVDELITQPAGRAATLLIVAPEADAERAAPAFTALLAAIVHAAEVKAASMGGSLSPRLLLALDEAGNTFRYPRLPHLLTTARGNGIQLLAVYHDLAQLEHLYDRPVARTVVSNAKLRLLLPGVGDLETLRYFSTLLGRSTVTRASRTRGPDGRASTSTSPDREDLAPLHALQQLPDGTAVCQYQNLPPARVRLRYAHTDRRLPPLLGTPATATAGAPDVDPAVAVEVQR